MKAGFYVEAFRSRTCCKVWRVEDLRLKPMYWGPWQRLKTAKKKATELRKDRVLTQESQGAVTDHGPSFVKVRVFEVGS